MASPSVDESSISVNNPAIQLMEPYVRCWNASRIRKLDPTLGFSYPIFTNALDPPKVVSKLTIFICKISISIKMKARKKLTMMVIPSIFVPEDWSFTFYEGLNRHPDTIFKNKTVAELGCGNGWISIAIAAKWMPSKVYGLDINPSAVKISWINLYLNALDENGQPVYDDEKKTLLDRVEFYDSDLLGYCRDNKIQLDRFLIHHKK